MAHDHHDFGAEVFVRRAKGPVIEICGMLLRVVDIEDDRVKLRASGPPGTLVVKARNKRTGHLVLRLAGGQAASP